MADLTLPDDLTSPPPDLQSAAPPTDLQAPPTDLQSVPQGQGSVSQQTKVPVDHLGLTDSELKHGKPDTSVAGSFARGAVRGVAPAVGGFGAGLAGAAAAQPIIAPIAAATGPAAPFVEGGLSLAAGLGAGIYGSEKLQEAQDYLIHKLPFSMQHMLGLDTAQQAEDDAKHPYASMAGQLAPNLLLMRPGSLATAGDQAAKPFLQRTLSSPTGTRVVGGALFGGQEAATEEYQQGKIDPGKVALAAGAGALMNKPTRAGQAMADAVTAPQRILTNIARGKPSDAPPDAGSGPAAGGPPSDLQSPSPQGTAPVQTPSQAPQTGEAVGLRFKSGPPQRATVDHYFDNGNAVRLKMDDGTVHDLTTADFLKNRAEPPEPIQQPPVIATTGQQLTPEERAAPPLEAYDEPSTTPKPARPAPLGGHMLNALDHANNLERMALDQTLNLSGAGRQDMLTESARLRRLYGHQDDAGTTPNAYAHPLSGEPAADLGELATARAANPDLYNGEYQPDPRTPNNPEELGNQPELPENRAPSVDPYAMEDVQRSRAPLPKGESLFDAIRAMGGIKDTGGDVNTILQDYKNPRFQKRLLNPNGLDPDRVRANLQEAGWFGQYDDGALAQETGMHPGDNMDDLYDLMDKEARGQKVYHPDSDIHQTLADRALLDQDLTSAGVAHDDPPEVAAQKLAEYRQSEGAAQMEWERQRGIYSDLEDISPEAQDALREEGYEPGSDVGAESEEPASHEGGGEPPGDLVSGPAETPGGGGETDGEHPEPAEDYPVEWEDLGRGVTADQTVIPGGERSAQQLAEAREAQGHGRIRPAAEQKEPGDLFAEPDRQKTLFQRQHPQTETPEFKRWFGDSKVVDADGNPAVVHHGTEKKFPAFKKNKATMGGITWFTSDRSAIERGEVGAQGKGHIFDMYASIKNPAGWKEYDQLGLGELKSRGFDGAILPEKDGTFTGFVFEPAQLKSVDNRGTFDPADPRLKYQTDQKPFGKRGGEAVKLSDDVIGRTLNNPSPEEAHLLNQVEALAEKIVPRATVRTMRSLGLSDEARSQAGITGASRITGATYTNGLRRLIALSLESPDALGTLKHEAIHYLRDRGLISPKEWSALDRSVDKNGLMEKHDIAGRYPDADTQSQREEAIAEEMAHWGKAPDSVPKMFRPMYERISRFMQQIGDTVRRTFGANVTANDVMSRIMTGEVGNRTDRDMDRMYDTQFQRSGDKEDERGRIKPVDSELSDWLASKGTPHTPVDLSHAVRDYLLDRQARTGNETLALYDGNTRGFSHVATEGMPNRVNFTPAMQDHLSNPNSNIIGHHNHPSARGLSSADISTLAFPGMHTVIAHAADGNWYGASLSPRWRQAVVNAATKDGSAGILAMHNDIRKAVNAAEAQVIPAFQRAVNTREITPAEAEAALHHTVSAMLADNGVIDYASSKELSDASAQIATVAGNRVLRPPDPILYDQGIKDILGRLPNQAGAEQPGAGSADAGEENSGPKGFEQPQGLPRGIDEVGDRMDSAADSMAEELKGAPPGTYARTLHKMSPPSGDMIFKVPNAVQNVTIRPETVARMDTRSGAIWNAEKAKEYEANSMVDALRGRISDTMLKLDDTSRNKVYAARELDRINGQTRQDTGHNIVARNEGADFAHFSKPGQVVTLNPQETAAYHALTDMFDRSWKNVMEGAARKVGWNGAWDKEDMAANIQHLKDTSENSADRGLAKSANRAAKIVSALDEQRRQGYHPLMRFGDYFAHVTPKVGTDMFSTGGFPKTVHFELAERGLMDDIRGGQRVGNQAPNYARDMLSRLEEKFPKDKFNIEHGFLAKNADMLDKVDIPSIEKLMTFMENDMLHSLRQEGRARGLSRDDAKAEASKRYDDLYGSLIDRLWDKTFKELESGYKKKSNTVPGYSDDFGRALGTYMHWTSRTVADQIHREAIDNAHTALATDPRVDSNVKKYWSDWKDYQGRPSSIFNKSVNGLARWAFLTTMGVNPSSTAVVGTHGLFMAGPTLSVGPGMGKAAPAYAKAMNHAMSAVKVDGTNGIHIPDVSVAGRTPAEKSFLKKLDAEGLLHSRAIEDMAALNEKQSDLWGSARSKARKVMDLALSNVSFMDRANRVASALSSYRLAGDPATLAQMDKAWSGNQIWRDRAAREGVNQESMARFMVPSMVGEYGPMNQAPIERNAGTRMLMGMHGFVTRLLSNMWKLGTMGPEGQKALLWTLGAFWTMAGADGIPFVQDVQNFTDALWKGATGKDPMIGYRIQSELASVFGKPGADMILHGPVSTLSGVDVASRLGLGDLLTRNWPTAENTLGAYPSIILGRARAAAADARKGHPGMAAAEFLPGGLRNAVRAGQDADQGIRTQTGKILVPQQAISPVDTAARVAGFTPEKVEHAYQRSDYRYRAKHAKMPPPPNPIPGHKDGGHVHAAAAETDLEPTPAQIEAGNYQKGHVKLHGFDISIETPQGAPRRGTGKDGKEWENRHETANYGYIRGGNPSADGDSVDCYIGPHHESRRVYIIDQYDPKTRKFDEVKIVFGARTIKEAKTIYDAGFSDGSGKRRRHEVCQVSLEQFKKWLTGNRTHLPFAKAA